jgi:FMN phosphatase YigB (HAD superfamily)
MDMYRAVLFDFYSVWGPDRLAEYHRQLQELDPEAADTVAKQIDQYYAGLSEMQEIADSLRFKFKILGKAVEPNDLLLGEENISPQIIQFIQYLHGHFLKVGVLANLGKQERQILDTIHQKYDLFDTITSVDTPGVALLSQETFSRALYDIGEPPESCVVVSGHEDYLQFAASVGMGAIRFEGFPALMANINQVISASA